MANQADSLRLLAEQTLKRIGEIASEEHNPAAVTPRIVAPRILAPRIVAPRILAPRILAPRILAVSSGKGGVGKTFASVNLSIALQRLGKRVLLFDADLGLSNVNVQYGVIPPRDLGHFIRGEASLEEAIVTAPPGVHVLSGGSGMPELYGAGSPELTRVLFELRQLSSLYDVVIIDTGAGLSGMVQEFLTGVPNVLLVTTPEPTSVTDAYAVIKFLSEKSAVQSVMILTNMCSEKAGERAASALRKASDTFLPRKIALCHVGSIPLESQVRVSITAQEPVMNRIPDSKICRQISQIAADLLAACLAGAGSPEDGITCGR